MKYLRSEQIEKLSPVKRLYYEKRLMWDRERIMRIDLKLPDYKELRTMPIIFPYGSSGWVSRDRMMALGTVYSNVIQNHKKLQQFLHEIAEES